MTGTTRPGAVQQPEVAETLRLLREETYGLQPALLLARLLVAPLPQHVGGRLRASALRLVGFDVGYGTMFAGMPVIAGSGDLRRRLHMGRHCWVNVGLHLDLGSRIEIGDHVTIGHDVLLLTTTHRIGSSYHRAGDLTTAPVCIGRGAWLGARSTIMPGVTIGEGAVIAAGAVVIRDVRPDTVVGGVPAQQLSNLAD
jgi:maltose O-acetyltransferase